MLSLVILARISSKVNSYLSAGQSGFRQGSSTADIVFGYRCMAAKSHKYQEAMEILGIDMRAFDTIRRDRLMQILETFLDVKGGRSFARQDEAMAWPVQSQFLSPPDRPV